MKKATANLLQVCVASFSFICTNKSIAIAQVTPDNTVGTQVNQNGNVAEITGGEARGDNLFHSFQDFSVPTGNEAFFDNATDISNIFSRVTGGNVSNISGLIRANDANLFLINPAGILFGAGARLDLGGGSFYGSTADSILFEDGEFSAVDNLSEPILTINAPIGLGFRDNPADITVRGDGNGVRTTDSEVIDTQEALRVSGDATIGIVGGNLIFEDATIKTAGGRIEIGSVGGGRVDLVEVANGFTFNYSGIEAFGDISLSGRSNIDASGNGGGDINVAGRNISLTGVSAFVSNTLGDQTGGDINVFATDAIEISGVENEDNFLSAIINRTFPNGTADAGDINIETGSLSLGNLAGILTFSSGQADAGNITINASDSVSLESQGDLTQIASSIAADAVGNAGNIVINSGSLNLNNGAFLAANNSGQGDAGDVTINLTEDFNIINNSSIEVVGRSGNSGNIELNLNSLAVDNSPISLFAANTLQGLGGTITINAVDNITFRNNSNIFVQGFPGGLINITATNLSLESGSGFFAGIGIDGDLEPSNIKSGDIAINLSEDLVIDGSGNQERLTNFSNSNFSSQGNSGNIAVNARNINLLNGGQITSNSNSEGSVGDITLNAAENVNIDGFNGNSISRISTFINTEGSGDVGEINITAQNLNVTKGSAVSSIVAGNGNSGDINLNITDSISIEGSRESTQNETTIMIGSSINSEVSSSGVGNSGNINIDTQNLFLAEEGNIRTNIVGQGNGGNVNINANFITMTELGNINSSSLRNFFTGTSQEANAGNITIETTSLLINSGSGINADTSATGDAGNITINATDKVLVDGTGTSISPELDDSSNIIPGTQQEAEFSSNISSDVVLGEGRGGSVEINTRQLSVTNGGQVSTSTLAQGNAGNLIINASESIELGSPETQTERRSGLFAIAFEENGNGGDLQIFTGELNISDDATINVGNIPSSISSAEPGTGEAGSLTIKANYLSLENNANIDATTRAGNGGNITLDIAENITLRDTSLISARALKDANGGNIDIDTNFIVAFPNGNNDIIATAEQGIGGNITINAESLFGIQAGELNPFTNDINASSEFSLDGNVTIDIPDTNSFQGETDLPQNIITTEQTTAQACETNREVVAQNGLTIKGKGGVPPAPESPLSSENISINGKYTNSTVTNPNAIATSQGVIIPARGIKVTEEGKIVLTSYRTDNSGERLPAIKNNCGV